MVLKPVVNNGRPTTVPSTGEMTSRISGCHFFRVFPNVLTKGVFDIGQVLTRFKEDFGSHVNFIGHGGWLRKKRLKNPPATISDKLRILSWFAAGLPLALAAFMVYRANMQGGEHYMPNTMILWCWLELQKTCCGCYDVAILIKMSSCWCRATWGLIRTTYRFLRACMQVFMVLSIRMW